VTTARRAGDRDLIGRPRPGCRNLDPQVGGRSLRKALRIIRILAGAALSTEPVVYEELFWSRIGFIAPEPDSRRSGFASARTPTSAGLSTLNRGECWAHILHAAPCLADAQKENTGDLLLIY